MNQEKTVLGQNFTMGRRVIAFLAILIVYFFYCYNFMVGIFVRPTLTGTFHFTLQQASSIFAIMSFGTIPGTIFAGKLATRFGKKRTLMGIGLTFAILTYLPLLNPSSYNLWRVARLGVGISLGGVFGTAFALVSDIFPQKYRGKLAAICTSTFSIAMIFAGQLYAALGDDHWRTLVSTAVIPPIIGVILIFFLVPDDASHMAKLREEAKEEKTKISYFEMYKGKYLLIGIGVILLSGLNFIGYSAYSNNATTYLTKTLGFSAVTAGSIYSLQGLGQLIGYNLWGFIADKFGRKFPIIGMILSAVGIFFFTKLGADNKTGFYILSLLLGLCFGYSGAWGAYYTEIFPEKFKSLSAGISFNGGRIISTYGLPLAAGLSVTSYGMHGVFIASMTVLIIGGIIWLLLPETLKKNKQN